MKKYYLKLIINTLVIKTEIYYKYILCKSNLIHKKNITLRSYEYRYIIGSH
jgi:hypothetical protein